MENLKNFFNGDVYTKFISSIIIVIISIVIYRVIIYFFSQTEKRHKLEKGVDRKRATYLKLIKSITRYIIMILTVLILLQVNGVNVSSLLAGVGIIGAVIGLAIQDWLKDIIRGSSIIADNYFSVGDIVKYNDIEGKVLVIGLKTTKIQDLKTGNIISIANRKIEEIEICSNKIYVTIPMPYEVPVKEAEKVIDEIIKSVLENENTIDSKYKSVNELASSSINYLIEVNCNPVYKLQVKRDTLRTILVVMEKHNISVPYTQIDIHEKKK